MKNFLLCIVSLTLIPSLLIASAAFAGELAGVVKDPNGKLVANAVVAVTPEKPQIVDGRRVRHITHTDAEGYFRFNGLPGGSYGATATFPKRGSAFRGLLSVPETGVLDKQILQLETSESTFEGEIHTPSGMLPEGLIIAANRVSNDAGDTFYGEVHDSHFQISLAPGRYQLAVFAPDWHSSGKIVVVPSLNAKLDFTIFRERGSDPALAVELEKMVTADQDARMRWIQSQDQSHLEETIKVDTGNVARLREIIATKGWPGAELVGTAGAEAAWLIVQHEDGPLLEQCLPWLKAEAERGGLAWPTVALSIDRVLIAEGKKQLYGSQAEIKDGKVELQPVEDEPHLDERRAQVGLEPIAEYKAQLLKFYTPASTN